jgi:undecaprenyl-diphosphatase
MSWLGQYEAAALVVLALAAGAVWVFMELAGDVSEGETHAFDQAILLALRNPSDLSDPLGPRWVEEAVRDITALGGTGILMLLTLGVVGYLVLSRRYTMALLVLVAIGGGSLLSTLLKQGFDRPRPDLVPHITDVRSASFPSGHSMLAAVTYLTLGALLARIQPKRRLKAYLLLFAALLAFAVGVSRVYLGVHWPTDVLAGWAAGAVWALLCWLVARWLQRRGQVERDQ